MRMPFLAVLARPRKTRRLVRDLILPLSSLFSVRPAVAELDEADLAASTLDWGGVSVFRFRSVDRGAGSIG